MRVDYWVKASITALGATFGYIFGGWSLLLQLLLALVIADYATGFLASAIQGKLASSIGFKGIAKKIMIFVMVGVAHLLDKVIGDGAMIQSAVIAFYAFNELLSIVENFGKAGVPVPSVIRQAVDVLRRKAGDPPNDYKNT